MTYDAKGLRPTTPRSTLPSMTLPTPNLRVPTALLDRAAALCPRVAAARPEMGAVTRADVLRMAMAIGLDAIERDPRATS